MVYTLKTLKQLRLQPKKDLGLLFVSDEEAENRPPVIHCDTRDTKNIC